ncbi:MAG: hypothetical protein ACREF9_21005, partial [Opitutaceae bacterium]
IWAFARIGLSPELRRQLDDAPLSQRTACRLIKGASLWLQRAKVRHSHQTQTAHFVLTMHDG